MDALRSSRASLQVASSLTSGGVVHHASSRASRPKTRLSSSIGSGEHIECARASLVPGARDLDLRKGFDALSIVVRSQLAQDPLSGSLYVFFNRRFDRAKVLVWTPSGWCLVYNQPSSHYTSFGSS